jgi:hypothetical protein
MQDQLYQVDKGYGATEGPYRIEQLRDLLEIGRVGPDDRVRIDNAGAWQSVFDLIPDARAIYQRRESGRLRRRTSDRQKVLTAVPKPIAIEPIVHELPPLESASATVPPPPPPPIETPPNNANKTAHKSLFIWLAALTAVAMAVYWPREDPTYPPPLTVAQAESLDPAHLLAAMTTELTRQLQSNPDPAAWRSLPGPSRIAWTIATWGDRLRLGGLLQTCADSQMAADGTTLADLVTAYRSVGATAVAETLESASALAKSTAQPAVERMLTFRKGTGRPPDPSSDPFLSLDKQLQESLGNITQLQAAYIREHLGTMLARIDGR